MCFCCEEVPVKEVGKKNKGVLYFDPVSRTWVKLTGVTVPTPLVYQQPLVGPHPMLAQPQMPQPTYQPYMIQPQPAINGLPAFNIQQPAFGTWGLTGNELTAQQMYHAQNSNMNKKQEMKPADDDPFRMYWVREEDGTWTQRNRLTIESGDIGECRWYAMDGQFYAVRLTS